MIRTGRIATVIALLGVLFYVIAALGDPIDLGLGMYILTLFAAVAVITAAASAVAWALAILHWALRYPGPHRRAWGLAVTVGTFVGAWIYWFKAVNREALALQQGRHPRNDSG